MVIKLYNKKSKQELIKNLNSEQFKRITCSFYNYIPIKSPQVLRDIIYSTFDSIFEKFKKKRNHFKNYSYIINYYTNNYPSFFITNGCN